MAQPIPLPHPSSPWSWSRTCQYTALEPSLDLTLSGSCLVVTAAEVCVEGREGRGLSGFENVCQDGCLEEEDGGGYGQNDIGVMLSYAAAGRTSVCTLCKNY